MTIIEVRQQKKNEALNEIRKIFNPKYKFPYDVYSEESYAEQVAYRIKSIIEELEKTLKNLSWLFSYHNI